MAGEGEWLPIQAANIASAKAHMKEEGMSPTHYI